MDDKVDKETATGIVTEALPNTQFKVRIVGLEQDVLVFLSGKMRMNRIKVLVGDKVLMEIDPYGGKPRVIKRL